MVRKSTSSSAPASVIETQPVVEKVDIAAAPPLAEISTSEKKARKPRIIKTVTTTVTEAVIDPVQSSQETVIVDETASPDNDVVNAVVADAPFTIFDRISEFNAKLSQFQGLLSTLRADYKALEKIYLRELKNAQKLSQRKRKASGSKQPSGFVKPTSITDELATFLGKETGIEMARTEVSKQIHRYITDNQLKDKVNGRKINADSKLATLLKLGQDDELTYFNLQRYMKHHFIKNTPVLAPTLSV